MTGEHMTQEALRMALEALETPSPMGQYKAITAIKEALAQPEQEPVAQPASEEDMKIYKTIAANYHKDLSTPPQRKPLTIGDVKIIWQNLDVREGVIMGLVRAVEAAHDIKENT